MMLWKVDASNVDNELYELELELDKVNECLGYYDWENPPWVMNKLRERKLEINKRIVEIKAR